MQTRDCLYLTNTFNLKLLALGGVGLVHLVLDLPHPLRLLNAELLAFLVPAPFVDLSFAQASLLAQREEGFLRPVRVCVKLTVEMLELVARLSLALADDPFEAAGLFVEDVSAALGGLQLHLGGLACCHRRSLQFLRRTSLASRSAGLGGSYLAAAFALRISLCLHYV